MFGSILDFLEIIPVIIGVKEIAFWEIRTAGIIGIEYVTSRFLLLIVNLDGWIFLFNTLSESFLFTPCCILIDGENIIFKMVISYLTSASVLFPIFAEGINNTTKPKSTKSVINSWSLSPGS